MYGLSFGGGAIKFSIAEEIGKLLGENAGNWLGAIVAIIIAGVVAISSYFIAGDFRRIDRYGFSIGILLILSGIIGLIRTGDLTANFEMYSGALSLSLIFYYSKKGRRGYK